MVKQLKKVFLILPKIFYPAARQHPVIEESMFRVLKTLQIHDIKSIRSCNIE